jgi:hypothetical protein
MYTDVDAAAWCHALKTNSRCAQVAATAQPPPPKSHHKAESGRPPPPPRLLPRGGAVNAPVDAAGRLARHLGKLVVVARYREDVRWLDALRPRIPFLVYQVRSELGFGHRSLRDAGPLVSKRTHNLATLEPVQVLQAAHPR